MNATWCPRDNGSACAEAHTARASVSALNGLWSCAISRSPISAAMKVCSSRSSYSAPLRMASMVREISTSIATSSSSTSDSVLGLSGFFRASGCCRVMSACTCSRRDCTK